MIYSKSEFLEWQHQVRTYWSLRWKGWRYGPEEFCRRLYSGIVHGERELNLDAPTSYCDKLNWMKLHYHRPEFKVFADKLAVRAQIEAKLGAEWLTPLLGVFTRPEEIPWRDLPEAFVLKTTHASGTNILCPDKSRFDRGLAVRRLRRWLRQAFYWYSLEWCYRELPRRILCETFLKGDDGRSPRDYKVMCFNGAPRIVWVDVDRFTRHQRAFYDPDWNRMACRSSWIEPTDADFPRPPQLEQMLAAARTLSAGYPFMRVDFYVVADRPIFGEITLYPGGGNEAFLPLSFDEEVGSWIPLPPPDSAPAPNP